MGSQNFEKRGAYDDITTFAFKNPGNTGDLIDRAFRQPGESFEDAEARYHQSTVLVKHGPGENNDGVGTVNETSCQLAVYGEIIKIVRSNLTASNIEYKETVGRTPVNKAA